MATKSAGRCGEEAACALPCKKAMPSQAHSSSFAPGRAAGRFGAACRVLEEAIGARAFPGCAFGVLAGGEVVLQGALGRFTYEEESPAVTVETVYDVASLTKVTATTATAMLLDQRGQLELDTPLGELLPRFVVSRAPEDAARRVTLRHLLAHSSGLPGYVELFRSATTPAALFRACLRLPLEAEPGTRAEYSDPGFLLLGKALEVRMRQRLAPWLRREVFRPLGMAATGFCPAPGRRSSIPPTEEDTTFRHRRIQGEVQDENAWVLRGVAGHAGLFSNVPDLLRFAGAILTAGVEKNSESKDSKGEGSETKLHLFEKTTLKRFTQRQGPEGSSRALGWDTPSGDSTSGRHFSSHSIGHLGFSGCSLWIDLDADIAVVLLTNRTWPDRKNRLIREVWPVFHDAVREAL
jgi:CubicO group peptidase (beta-lactamase class C family)